MLVNGIERDYIIHDDNQVLGFFGDYRYLSNFHTCKVQFDGIIYPSSENAYMAAKSLNPEVRKRFLTCSAKDAKDLGRQIILRDDWEEIKYSVMHMIIMDKFYRNLDIRELLLDTNNKYLEETNHWNDMYWGKCNGKGKNNLGKILMQVRDSFQYENHR